MRDPAQRAGRCDQAVLGGQPCMYIDRVSAVAIATRQGGDVVYERFYEPFSEVEKAEIREAMHMATVHAPGSDEESLGQYR